jgi:hypothetical protein
MLVLASWLYFMYCLRLVLVTVMCFQEGSRLGESSLAAAVCSLRHNFQLLPYIKTTCSRRNFSQQRTGTCYPSKRKALGSLSLGSRQKRHTDAFHPTLNLRRSTSPASDNLPHCSPTTTIMTGHLQPGYLCDITFLSVVHGKCLSFVKGGTISKESAIIIMHSVLRPSSP